MQRKFVRISLGGVRDEAEIRGHRRTYIGAMPGRIVQALKQAGSIEPGVHARRDRQARRRLPGRSGGGAARGARPGAEPQPSAITTSRFRSTCRRCCSSPPPNQLGTVHPALLDRMEIISLSGYTEEDKIHIARRYPPAAPAGRTRPARRRRWSSSDAAPADRDQRVHARSRRAQPGAADRHDRAQGRGQGGRRRAPTDSIAPTVVGADDVDDYLGPARFKKEVAFRTSAPGVATGLAWTEAGGDVLFIEASMLPGGTARSS